jgi:glutamyl-tRNA synthetase
VFIKHLLAQGLAYPCRMTEEELNTIRDEQMKAKKTPGIYGDYSKYRTYTPDELIATYHEAGDTFPVIRFRSPGDTTKKILFTDEIRGEISMLDNYNDIVILKGDGLPTYHLAHIVDDTLMRTSLVTRGDEWLASVPLHLQLFEAFQLPAPKYAHLAPVCKMDEGKKRKLSKRHDPEANVAFLFEQGYSVQGILEYLMTLADSSFEDWRRENPDADFFEFHFSLDKMNVAGPLFDEVKLNWVNNSYLSKISTEELFAQTLAWAREYAPEFASLLLSDAEYAKAAINIERHTEKDPKRFTLYPDVQNQILFFFDEEWENGAEVRKELLNPQPSATPLSGGSMGHSVLQDFVREYVEVVDLETNDVLVWFDQLKQI